jgi:acetyl esterase/lipase
LIRSKRFRAVLGAMAAALCARGAERETARDWASLIGQRFRAERDVVYKAAGGFNAKIDLYVRYDRQPGPTILYIHGGGWANGSKEQYVLWFLPYFELGMRVVSVQYRLSGVAPAPAAVEDCRCAFRWVVRNAEKYGIDTNRIVITGGSAGGHLALMTGMLEPSAGFDGECPGEEALRPAAIINYYGNTDVLGAYERKSKSALLWLRGAGDPKELARRLSPLTYVRAGLPPILTIHGDADEAVPYEDGVRLHEALEEERVPNQLLTIRGGRHGRFHWADEDTIKVQRTIEAFLTKHGVVDPR